MSELARGCTPGRTASGMLCCVIRSSRLECSGLRALRGESSWTGAGPAAETQKARARLNPGPWPFPTPRLDYRLTPEPVCTLMTVVPSPDGPDDWMTLTLMTRVPSPVKVAVARLPEVVTAAGDPPSKVHS